MLPPATMDCNTLWRVGNPLQGPHNQFRDQAKVSGVRGRDSMAQFQRSDSNEQIREWDARADCLHLTINLPRAESDRHCHWMDRHPGKQIIQESPPACTCCGVLARVTPWASSNTLITEIAISGSLILRLIASNIW
jgi:hypothetical protein